MKKMRKQQKVPVTMRALTQRLGRALAKQDEKLVKHRGDFHVVDVRMNGVVQQDVDIVALGRELGALKPWEKVEAKGGSR